MAKIHVLTAVGRNLYTVVVHEITPVANNSANFTWASVLVNSGRAVTIMTEGTGPGQITPAEKAEVLAGTTLEGVFLHQDDPSWTAGQRNAAIDARAASCIAELQARLQYELKWFGATRT